MRVLYESSSGSRTLTFELYTGVNGGRVIAMDKVKARLRKVFGRFKKDELPKVLLQLGLEGGEKTANKREFVSFLVDKCVVSMHGLGLNI